MADTPLPPGTPPLPPEVVAGLQQFSATMQSIAQASLEVRTQLLAEAREQLATLRRSPGLPASFQQHLAAAEHTLDVLEGRVAPVSSALDTPLGRFVLALRRVAAAVQRAAALPPGRGRAPEVGAARAAWREITSLAPANLPADQQQALHQFGVLIDALEHADRVREEAETATQERVRQFFQKRAVRLKAACDEAICEHPGLIGDQVEDAVRKFLSEVLPRRYAVDRGMVYSERGRSQEADVVVWDALNYPRIPQGEALFLFAHSVQLVVEVKTVWKSETRADVLAKCRTVHDLATLHVETRDEDGQIVTGPAQSIYPGKLITRRPDFAAIAINGGQMLSADTIAEDLALNVTAGWLPRLVLLLGAGKVLWTRRDPTWLGDGRFDPGQVDLIDAGDDALLFFTASLLRVLAERSPHAQPPFYLDDFCATVLGRSQITQLEFMPSLEGPARFTPVEHRE